MNAILQAQNRAAESASFARAPQATGELAQISKPVRLVLPPALSANKYWRPVRIGQHITIVPTKEAKAYRRDVALLAKQAGVKPVPGRVALTVRMYPARPQDWAKRAAKDPDHWDDGVRSIDLDNCLKVLLDALKNVAFDDDVWVRRIDAERCEPDEHGARVVVTIAPIVREPTAPRLFA
jgi:crossover junction endodeoxyribonuclease RusA